MDLAEMRGWLSPTIRAKVRFQSVAKLETHFSDRQTQNPYLLLRYGHMGLRGSRPPLQRILNFCVPLYDPPSRGGIQVRPDRRHSRSPWGVSFSFWKMLKPE